MTGSTASPRSAARHARINMRAAASELVTSTRIRFIDPSPAQRNTLRAEVRDQPFHRLWRQAPYISARDVSTLPRDEHGRWPAGSRSQRLEVLDQRVLLALRQHGPERVALVRASALGHIVLRADATCFGARRA